MYVKTTLLIDEKIKNLAKQERLNMSKICEDALKEKVKHLL